MSQRKKNCSSSQQPNQSEEDKKKILDNERIEKTMALSIASIVMTSDNRTFQRTCMDMIQTARDRALALAAGESVDVRPKTSSSEIVERSNSVMYHLYIELLKKMKSGDL